MCRNSSCNEEENFPFLVIRRFIGMEVMAVIFFAVAIGWWVNSTVAVLSTLLGGAAYVIPSFFFARRFFSVTSSRTVKQIVMVFYFGEIMKLLLNGGLIILIILFIPVAIFPLIVGFIGGQVGFWLAHFLIRLDRIRCI